jgi:hypothetical protein
MSLPTPDELRTIVATLSDLDPSEIEDIGVIYTTKDCRHPEHNHGGIATFHTFPLDQLASYVALLDEIADILRMVVKS